MSVTIPTPLSWFIITLAVWGVISLFVLARQSARLESSRNRRGDMQRWLQEKDLAVDRAQEETAQLRRYLIAMLVEHAGEHRFGPGQLGQIEKKYDRVHVEYDAIAQSTTLTPLLTGSGESFTKVV